MSTTMAAGRWSLRHLTGTARSGPPPDRPPSPPPPPPPPSPPPVWRNWLLVLGLLLTVALYLLPVPATGKVEQLSYSQLKSDIAAGQVQSVKIGPDGGVSGKLTSGTRFTSSYPTNLQDPQFAQLLDQHDIQVTTQPAQTSIWSVLVNFLPLAFIFGLFVWTGRSARRQLAGMGVLSLMAARHRAAPVPSVALPDRPVVRASGHRGCRSAGVFALPATRQLRLAYRRGVWNSAPVIPPSGIGAR